MTAQQVYNLALETAQQVAATYGMNPVVMAEIATCIAKKESTFNPGARNPKPGSTAWGLMQILTKTRAYIEKSIMKTASLPHSSMFDPKRAMLLGCHYLGYQYKRYKGNVDQAVWAYNQGSYSEKKTPGGRVYLAAVQKIHRDGWY